MASIKLTSCPTIIVPVLIHVYVRAIDCLPMLRVWVFGIGLVSYRPSYPDGFGQLPCNTGIKKPPASQAVAILNMLLIMKIIQ